MLVNYYTKKNIIKRLKFSVEEYGYIDKYGDREYYILIVLNDEVADLPLKYTRYEDYIPINPREYKKETTIKKKAYNICQLLNYLFLETQQIDTLADVTDDMLQEFFDHYVNTRNDKGNLKRSKKDTVKNCVYDVLGFMENYINAFSSKKKFRLNIEDLYYQKDIYNHKTKGYKDTPTPNFYIKYPTKSEKKFREFPESYFDILLSVAKEFMPEMVFPLAIQAYTGIREGGICNITMGSINVIEGLGYVSNIEIDITEDAFFEDFPTKKVGHIKKCRLQKVYTPFIDEFYKYYINHLKYLEVFLKDKNRKFEIGNKHLPLFYNSYGKPLTVETYSKKLKKLFYDYFLPTLYRLAQIKMSDNAIDFAYYEKYKEEYPGAHCLRHWFTMQLVNDGLSVGEIMKWRGDTNPNSALDYIHNQGYLKSKFKETTLTYQDIIWSEINDTNK